MHNISVEHHIAVQTGAVRLAGPIREALAAELSSGMRNIFFAGAGGVAYLTRPAADLLQSASSFPTYVVRAAELVEQGNVNLGRGSLVVLPSVSGTTKEAIAALEFAQRAGARVLTLTGTAGTPLATAADLNFQNDCADDTSSENYYLQSLLVALAIMDLRGELADYDRIVSEIALLPGLFVEAKRAYEEQAAALAAEIADEQHHIMIGAGNAWYEAWYYGMCILEEMQWIWTRPVHASDFFHGTLELVEADTPVFLLKGEDASRPLADRVESFVSRYSARLRILDTRSFDLPGLSDDVRALVSPALLATLLERLSAHLESVREHPLTTRRYYKRVEY